tara:strand:- start:99 stop:557 length:459 start_codon:yes stop_codon:yes gene_type:complete
MKIILRTTIGMFIVFFMSIAQANEDNHNAENLIEIVKLYYKALDNVRQENSTKNDVENLIQLLSNDFRYEHPKFEANGNRKEMREGITFVLGKQRNSIIKIESYIEGLNAVFVKIESSAEVKRDGKWEIVSGPETTLFEINGNKISRIHEYW